MRKQAARASGAHLAKLKRRHVAKSFADEEMGVAALLNNAASAGDDGCSRTEDGHSRRK